MKVLLTSLVVCALIPSVFCATAGVWCYHDASCSDSKWPELFPKYCNGSRQSPININTSSATTDTGLTAFTFVNYDNKSKLSRIENTGKTVKVTLDSGATVSGGQLPETYDSLQFHLHWGDGTTTPGSEHTVDGKRFAMEMHIVNAKSSYNGNTTEAVKDSKGLAALGFFIEASSDSTPNQPESWNTLTSFLSNILTSGSNYSLTSANISLDDLLSGVDRTKYYRYLGSLTTPTCNEAVVWTVFKESIKISSNLIDKFGSTVHIGDSSSAKMTKVYRSIQPDQEVTYSGSSRNVVSSTFLGVVALFLVQLWA